MLRPPNHIQKWWNEQYLNFFHDMKKTLAVTHSELFPQKKKTKEFPRYCHSEPIKNGFVLFQGPGKGECLRQPIAGLGWALGRPTAA